MARKISILIVDDEESVRDSLYNWFLEDGFRVECAENAKKALTILESDQFDIILADIKMPGMDGLEMLRRIKSLKPDAIVIVMTAFATVDTAVKALKDGAYDYVTKPFDPDDLTHLIRNAKKQISLSEENENLKNKVIRSDFRVICATNKDLKNMVEKGTFREDLFYRLNVVNIQIPPLRKRKEDIPLLVNYFIKKYCTSMNKPAASIDSAALTRIQEFNFPGNIRELENMIERAIVVGNGRKICLKDLPLEKSMVSNSAESLDDFEKAFILQILNKYSWNISRTAKALKVDRVTLYNKIKKYNLNKADQ